MAYTRRINVDWTYPREYNSAINSDHSIGQGLYQITRKIGDNETLLYIGIVTSKERDLYQRLEEHRTKWLDEVRGTIIIRFGRIVPCQGLTIDEKLIDEVESLLIFETQAKINIQKKQSYTVRHDIEVTNTGNYGKLPKVIDSNEH